jgi:hypothetical protein
MLQCFWHKKFLSGRAEQKFKERKTSCKGNVKIKCYSFVQFLCYDTKHLFHGISIIKVTCEIIVLLFGLVLNGGIQVLQTLKNHGEKCFINTLTVTE